LRIANAIFESIRAHGERTYPYECCGALLGKSSPQGWQVAVAVPAANARTDSARNRYEIAPLELIRIDRQARQLGLEIAGFYHSHPDRPAQWSAIDLAEAHWLGCSYVIVEVAHGKAAATNAFLLAGRTEEEKHFVPELIALAE